MTADVPEYGAAFEQMMREIDAALINENIPITARPLRAVRAVSSKYKISIPISSISPGAPHELQRYAKLSDNIDKWYRHIYGDRLKIDFSPGRMVTRIEGDFYVLRFPRIFGQVEFIATQQFFAAENLISRGPVVCNILQCVEGLTPGRAGTLSDDVLRSIGDDFSLGLRAV